MIIGNCYIPDTVICVENSKVSSKWPCSQGVCFLMSESAKMKLCFNPNDGNVAMEARRRVTQLPETVREKKVSFKQICEE